MRATFSTHDLLALTPGVSRDHAVRCLSCGAETYNPAGLCRRHPEARETAAVEVEARPGIAADRRELLAAAIRRDA